MSTKFGAPPKETFVSSLDIPIDDGPTLKRSTHSKAEATLLANSSLYTGGMSAPRTSSTSSILTNDQLRNSLIKIVGNNNNTTSSSSSSTTMTNMYGRHGLSSSSTKSTATGDRAQSSDFEGGNNHAVALSAQALAGLNPTAAHQPPLGTTSGLTLNGHSNERAAKTNALTAINSPHIFHSSKSDAGSIDNGHTGSTTQKSRAVSEKREGSSTSCASPLPDAQHFEYDEEPTTGPSVTKNPTRKYVNELPRAPPLDFNTIRTHAPRFPNPPARPRNRSTRMFGLQHAPVYHPTIDEFAKPMEYIEKIAIEAKEWGICKIVPPEGWRPPFALNTETFRFKTRLQQLNSMEATARASLNFLEQLYLFHRQQGSVGIHIPTITGKPIDMFRLKREVTNLGGYVTVTNHRKWTSVAKAMGYNTTMNNTICSQIKTSYLKIIVPFEDYVARVKLNGGTPPPDPMILNDDIPILENMGLNTTPKVAPKTGSSAASDAVGEEGESVGDAAVRTASDKFNEAMQDAVENPDKVPTVKLGGLLPTRDIKKKIAEEELPGEACEICSKDTNPDRIVLCDGCDRGYHLDCLSPPLAEVPKSQFFCDECLLLNGADYGFDEGEEHSLYSFRKRADAFKRKWIHDHPVPKDKGKHREFAPAKGYAYVNAAGEPIEPPPLDEFAEQVSIEDHIEREFWRLVESPHETVEIEYGADVNHTNDGGGLPNLEIHPSDPYSRDGWNLNNLPILNGSLLRYIKSDISGMTIPWIYVGMVFSTFAWHKEDHYTYSINYHHFGDTKTWYGIPGEDDEKLEAAMKLAAPELFDQQPDLMFQLVTLMSPGRLKKHGVRVCACDQRPNEFVITFPRAYHAGFNHGFNFNEAVNFALPDWLQTDLACVEKYRTIGKNPVFSHDELIVTIGQHEKGPRASRWLLPSYREMVERELAGRERIRRLFPGIKEDVDPTELDEEEYQCQQCKVLCYLSQLVSFDQTHIACLDHSASLKDFVDERRPMALRLKYSDEDLQSMLARVKSRSDKAGRLPTDVLVGPIEGGLAPPVVPDQRTTGRKRKPSALALEALENEEVLDSLTGVSPPPTRVSQRPRVDSHSLPPVEVAPSVA